MGFLRRQCQAVSPFSNGCKPRAHSKSIVCRHFEIEPLEQRRLLSSVLLNEVEANPPGTDDNRYEYVELAGTPGLSLTNDYFVTFDGSAGTTGVADLVMNLTGFSLGTDGLLVIQSSPSHGHSIPAATAVVSNSTFFTKTGGFANGTLSFFLFNSPTNALIAGTDYDSNNSFNSNNQGTLNLLPAGAAVLDSVAILDTNNSTDIVYGNVDVTEKKSLNTGTCDAVTRFPGTTATTNSAWYGGELDDTGNVDSTIDYDPTRAASNEPANSYLTPGAVNYPQFPVFNSASYSFNVQQTAAAATAVGSVSATAGGTDTLTYSLSGTGNSNFSISSTGAITVASGATLSGTGYSLTATAKDDQDSDSATAPVTIGVLSAPVFNPASYTFSVLNSAGGGASVGTVSATPEAGDTLTFSLSGTGSTSFSISAAGAITAATGGPFALSTYSLTATATDNQNADFSTAPVAITITPAPLNLIGPAFYLQLDGDTQHLDLWNNATIQGHWNQQLLLANISTVSIQGTTGSDSVTLDSSIGSPLPAGGLLDTGGTGGTGNSLTVIGSAGNDSVTSSTGQITLNGTAINSANVAMTIFTPGTGTDSLSVNSGSLELAPPAAATGITAMTFSSVAIGTGAQLTVATPTSPAKRSVLVASSLTLAQSAGTWTGTLDLTGNDLIVRSGMLSTLRSEIQSGYNAGSGDNWLGSGITSSSAASNTTHLMTLGLIQNSLDGTPTGTALYAQGTPLGEFDQVNTISSDMLVRYTFYGDANLSRTVDGSDYSLIDSGYQHQPANWYNGDFDYNNSIDGSDYTLIDNAFNTQNAISTAKISGAESASQAQSASSRLIAVPSNTFSSQSPNTPENPGDSSIESQMLRKDLLDALV